MKENPQSAAIIGPAYISDEDEFSEVRKDIEALETMVEESEYDWQSIIDNCDEINNDEEFTYKADSLVLKIELALGEIVGYTVTLQSIHSEAEGLSMEVNRKGYYWEVSIPKPRFVVQESWTIFS